MPLGFDLAGPVRAEPSTTICDLGVFVDEAAEPIASDDLDVDGVGVGVG
jgi:hypothetical protein